MFALTWTELRKIGKNWENKQNIGHSQIHPLGGPVPKQCCRNYYLRVSFCDALISSWLNTYVRIVNMSAVLRSNLSGNQLIAFRWKNCFHIHAKGTRRIKIISSHFDSQIDASAVRTYTLAFAFIHFQIQQKMRGKRI